MNCKWHFNERKPQDRLRDPANEAFFSAESLEGIGDALVREGIQNSLDAADRSGERQREVRVRIRLVTRSDSTTETFLREVFEGADEHFRHGCSRPDAGAPLASGLGFLVFEDFGTTGLDGDIAAWDPQSANGFWSFFRAEGRSGKTKESLGRWGIGKQVFQAASTAGAFFGLTVRREAPARVVMGSSVIRSRTIAGTAYHPDGMFGAPPPTDLHPVMPVTEAGFLDEFSSAFGLERRNELGLSIVVPYLDPRVNADDIRQAVVRSFFWPILRGELVVDIDVDGKSTPVDAESLSDHRTKLDPDEASVVEFAEWAAFAKQSEIVDLPIGENGKPDWVKSGAVLLPEPIIEELRGRLERDKRFAVRVGIAVRPKRSEDGPDTMSQFTVFYAATREHGHRTIFLRDGIVISAVRAAHLHNSRSFVVVEHRALVGMLGDSEGVNHTEWQKNSPKFDGRYTYGPQTISFVTRSVAEIVRRLDSAEKKGDPNLLLHLFYLPEEEGAAEKSKKPKPDAPGDQSDSKGAGERKHRRYVLERTADGFLLVPGDAPADHFPVRVRVTAAYNVRRGNAYKKWVEEDFQFGRAPLRLEPKPKGAVVTRQEGRFFEVELREPKFSVGVSGFDRNRDLRLNVVEIGEDHE